MTRSREKVVSASALKPDPFVFFWLFLLALVLRLIPLKFGIESTDIQLYRQQAIPVLQGQNIYAATQNIFPYLPVSMFYPALCLRFSEWMNIPFHIVIKLMAIASDVGIVLILYGMGRKFFSTAEAITIAVLYAINPVSILIVSFHGNIMSLVVLLMLAAYFYLSSDREKHLSTSGLLLGMAIGWRSFPVLLLPLFLMAIWDLPVRQKLKFIAYVLLPNVIMAAPFLMIDAKTFLHSVLGYSGWGIHHGTFAVLRGFYLRSLQMITWRNPPEWFAFYTLSKVAFMIFYVFLLLGMRRPLLISKIIITFLLFYISYAGVASQYLIWILPFLLLVKDRSMFYIFTVITGYTLVIFYWTFFPDILFGDLAVATKPVSWLVDQYIISQMLFSLMCLSGIFFFAWMARSRNGAKPMKIERQNIPLL